MTATNQFEDDLLDLIFTNVTAPNIGDATGIAGGTAGSIQVSLHTATLSDTDTLSTASEAAYTSYARETVARSLAGWTVAAGTVDNDAAITFTTATGGSETETDFGLTLATTGNYLQIFGALTASLAVSNGITPEFAIGDLDISIN
jgi:hypothetical protein